MPKATELIEITSKRPLFPDLAEAWRRRGLAAMLVRRNVKLRYTQTALGSVWIVLQSLLLTGTLTLVLGMLLSMPSDGVPYVLFAFTGTVIWSAFSRVVNETSMSMVASGNLILKVYFPRVLVPISGAVTNIIDVVPAYVILILTVAAYGMLPGWPILLSPVFLLLLLVLAFAIGMWITMIDAVYRDIRIVIPSVLQLMFFMTPIMYSETVVPEKWALLYRLNPLVGILRAFRWSMIAGAAPPSLVDIIWCLGFSVGLLAGGLVVFARLEQYAIDRI
jgi:lipopolysaccharide transport system permease protein